MFSKSTFFRKNLLVFFILIFILSFFVFFQKTKADATWDSCVSHYCPAGWYLLSSGLCSLTPSTIYGGSKCVAPTPAKGEAFAANCSTMPKGIEDGDRGDTACGTNGCYYLPDDVGVPGDNDVTYCAPSPMFSCTGKFLDTNVTINNKTYNVEWDASMTGNPTTGADSWSATRAGSFRSISYSWSGIGVDGSGSKAYSFVSHTADAVVMASIGGNVVDSKGTSLSSKSNGSCSVDVPINKLNTTCTASLIPNVPADGVTPNVKFVATNSGGSNPKYTWGGSALGAPNASTVSLYVAPGKTASATISGAASFSYGGHSNVIHSSNTNNTCKVEVPLPPKLSTKCTAVSFPRTDPVTKKFTNVKWTATPTMVPSAGTNLQYTWTGDADGTGNVRYTFEQPGTASSSVTGQENYKGQIIDSSNDDNSCSLVIKERDCALVIYDGFGSNPGFSNAVQSVVDNFLDKNKAIFINMTTYTAAKNPVFAFDNAVVAGNSIQNDIARAKTDNPKENLKVLSVSQSIASIGVYNKYIESGKNLGADILLYDPPYNFDLSKTGSFITAATAFVSFGNDSNKAQLKIARDNNIALSPTSNKFNIIKWTDGFNMDKYGGLLKTFALHTKYNPSSSSYSSSALAKVGDWLNANCGPSSPSYSVAVAPDSSSVSSFAVSTSTEPSVAVAPVQKVKQSFVENLLGNAWGAIMGLFR